MKPVEIIEADERDAAKRFKAGKEKDNRVKGQYLTINVCPKELPVMPYPNIGSDTIERVLDRAINDAFRDVFSVNVSIRFDWKNQYTVMSPCAGNLRFDDKENMPKFRAHGTAAVKEELADGTLVLKGVNLTHITINDHPAKILPKGSFEMKVHKEKRCIWCDSKLDANGKCPHQPAPLKPVKNKEEE